MRLSPKTQKIKIVTNFSSARTFYTAESSDLLSLDTVVSLRFFGELSILKPQIAV